MPTSVEAQGLTVDEAIQTALNQLGASRDRVEIEILHHPRGGFLGIGARRAKVRATLRQDAFRDGQEFDMAPRRRPARRRRGRGRGESRDRERQSRSGKEGGEAAAPQPEARNAGRNDRGPKNAGAADSAPKRGRRRRGGRARGGRGSGAGQAGKRESTDRTPRSYKGLEPGKPAEQADRSQAASDTRRTGPSPVAARTSSSEAGETASESAAEQTSPAPDLESLRDQAGKLTAGLIGKMGFEATVEVGLHGHEDPQVVVKVTSEAEGMLIGRRGQTLDALEHILNRMIFAGETAGNAAVTLDIGGYRERRHQTVQDMATRFRDRALIEQCAVQISPLSIRDRRIVQEVLGDDRTVVLKVVGVGPYRRIQITPAGMAEAPASERGSGTETDAETARGSGGHPGGGES